MKYPKIKCKFYKSPSEINGCTALNRLYCKIEDKPCNFFQKRDTEKTTAETQRVK